MQISIKIFSVVKTLIWKSVKSTLEERKWIYYYLFSTNVIYSAQKSSTKGRDRSALEKGLKLCMTVKKIELLNPYILCISFLELKLS